VGSSGIGARKSRREIEDMKSDVDAKLKELVAALSDCTGVPTNAVEKVLATLGVEKSLKRREAKGELGNVKLDLLRIASGGGADL